MTARNKALAGILKTYPVDIEHRGDCVCITGDHAPCVAREMEARGKATIYAYDRLYETIYLKGTNP